MTYTLHGDPAIIVVLLAILGAMHILDGLGNWVLERISIDLHPLWHVIPRRFKVSVRWDRPHAMVTLPDGSEAVILYVQEHDDAPYSVALVQPCDEDEDLGPAIWVPVGSLSSLPGHSLRETWRAMRGKENERA
jgi:hypothetical protein